jgi:hypothetical protein
MATGVAAGWRSIIRAIAVNARQNRTNRRHLAADGGVDADTTHAVVTSRRVALT